MALFLFDLCALLELVSVPYSAGQTISLTNLAVPTQATPSTCEPITIPICINLNWTNTSFPNLRSHTTQDQAYEELADFIPLIQAQCSNKIVHFLCAVYAPICLNIDGEDEPVVLAPCRSLCEYVRNDCEPKLNAAGYTWVAHLNCDNFPTGLSCVDVDDDTEIPFIPGLEVNDSRSATTSVITFSSNPSLLSSPSPKVVPPSIAPSI